MTVAYMDDNEVLSYFQPNELNQLFEAGKEPCTIKDALYQLVQDLSNGDKILKKREKK